MTRLAWNAVGERFYETGLDRGVLYVAGQPGVSWSGLISVNEKAVGGERTPRYFDGFKYANDRAPTEFEATLQAFTYPDLFEECQGKASATAGVMFSDQKAKEFGLAYRTLVGNDIEGSDHAYKLHLIYNATASPAAADYTTVNASPSPSLFNWDISTRPIRTTGFLPVAHVVLDSRDIATSAMEDIEAALYGTADTEPYLPTPAQIVELTKLVLDARKPNSTFEETYNGGTPSSAFSLIDGGNP